MDTLTNTNGKVKSKRGERSLKIGPEVNGLRALALTTNGETVSYYLKEIPVDFGRGFQLDKFYTEEANEDDRQYHVHLDKELGDSCTCKGFVLCPQVQAHRRGENSRGAGQGVTHKRKGRAGNGSPSLLEGAPMLIRHATPLRNLASIRRVGLLTGKSQGRRKAVWLHTASKSTWAVLHTVKRHGGKVENVVILEIDVPRSWLRRSRRGLRYSIRDVPATRIRRVIRFAELAGPVAA